MKLSNKTIEIVKKTISIISQKDFENLAVVFFSEASVNFDNVHNLTNLSNNNQFKTFSYFLKLCFENIENLNNLNNNVFSHIFNKHVSLSIQPEQYKLASPFLLKEFENFIRNYFVSEKREEIMQAITEALIYIGNFFISQEAILYRKSLENNGWIGWKEFTISKKCRESEDVISFYLVPSDNSPIPNFIPGQFISLKIFVPNLGFEQSRQYSLSDRPGLDYLRISVKKDIIYKSNSPSNMISHLLHNDYNEGDKVLLTAPHGDFILKETENPVVLISAGVGITPIMSMLNHLLFNNHNDIFFLYSYRSEESFIFEEYIKENPKIKKFFYCSQCAHDRAERMNLVNLANILPKNGEYYICGPKEFMEDQIKSLKEIGIGEKNIKFEVFGIDFLTCQRFNIASR